MTSPPPAPGHVALLPCPFCGAQPNPGGPYPENYEGPIRYFGEGGVRIECTACGARSRIVPPEHAMSEPEAIGAWNRRAPSPPAEAPQEAMPHLNPRYMVPEITRKAPPAAPEAVPEPTKADLDAEGRTFHAAAIRLERDLHDARPFSASDVSILLRERKRIRSAPSAEASVERLVKAAREMYGELYTTDSSDRCGVCGAHYAIYVGRVAQPCPDPDCDLHRWKAALSAFGAAEGGER